MLKKFNLIISNTSRSCQYLKIFFKNKIFPKVIIYLDDKKKSINRLKLKKIIKQNKKLSIKLFKTDNVNDDSIVKYLIKTVEKNIIYSGYPGRIITSKKLLELKNILHSHSGYLPHYKGSTTIFYSLLKEKKIYCTTFIMTSKIDDGKILLIKKYPIPKNIFSIDKTYDDKIRANNSLEVVRKFYSLKKKSNKRQNFLPYYVIHPVLRSFAFKKNMNKLRKN